MAKRSKEQPATTIVAPPIHLARSDATPLITIEAVTRAALSASITRLTATRPLPRTIALIAATRQEGVTYLAQAIGAIIASDLTRRVCVVELNWNWPRLGVAHNEPPIAPPTPAGLAEVLAGVVRIDDALIPTSIEGLSLLAAGNLPLEQRSATIRGNALREQIALLRDRFDHLILDVPAILTTSDAIPLAGIADASCVIVRQGVTPRQTLLRALDDVKHLDMLGIMLNQVRVATPAWLRGFIPQE